MATATRRAAGASPLKSDGKASASGRKQAGAAKEATGAGAPSPPSSSSPLAQAFYQHGGLALCVTGVALLWMGYGKGWMHDTQLTLLCVAFNLAGLFLHETRPFSVSRCWQCCLPLARFLAAESNDALSAHPSSFNPPPPHTHTHSSSASSRRSARRRPPRPRRGSLALAWEGALPRRCPTRSHLKTTDRLHALLSFLYTTDRLNFVRARTGALL